MNFILVVILLLGIVILLLSQTPPPLPPKQKRYQRSGSRSPPLSSRSRNISFRESDKTNTGSRSSLSELSELSLQASGYSDSASLSIKSSKSSAKNSTTSSGKSSKMDKYVAITEKDIGIIIGHRDSFSYMIWKAVWSNCYYECYSKHHFGVFKKKVFDEINLYRKYHQVLPLVTGEGATYLAEKYLLKYVIKKKCGTKKEANFGIICDTSHSRMASLLVNNWYNKGIKYHYWWQTKLCLAPEYSEMLWKATKMFGIAVKQIGNHMYTVCVFNPKGNIKGLYNDNVLKRKRLGKN